MTSYQAPLFKVQAETAPDEFTLEEIASLTCGSFEFPMGEDAARERAVTILQNMVRSSVLVPTRSETYGFPGLRIASGVSVGAGTRTRYFFNRAAIREALQAIESELGVESGGLRNWTGWKAVHVEPIPVANTADFDPPVTRATLIKQLRQKVPTIDSLLKNAGKLVWPLEAKGPEGKNWRIEKMADLCKAHNLWHEGGEAASNVIVHRLK